MIIDLAGFGIDPKPIEVEFGAGNIDLGDELEISGKAVFAGRVWKTDGKRLHIRGRLLAPATVQCVRCLEPVAVNVDVEFEDVYVDEADEARDAEIELGENEMEESIAIGGKVDMADVVYEQIILAVSASAVCREDCAGLCDKCGANRNLIDCKCKENEIDPRWAALKDLN